MQPYALQFEQVFRITTYLDGGIPLTTEIIGAGFRIEHARTFLFYDPHTHGAQEHVSRLHIYVVIVKFIGPSEGTEEKRTAPYV